MFIALDTAHDAVRLLKTPIAIIARRDVSLADQLRRAACSAVLNLAEGRRRRDRDRAHFVRIAAGSAAEARAALDLAVDLGYLDARPEAWARLDRVLALTWPWVKP
jgi:four helix bundle protein